MKTECRHCAQPVEYAEAMAGQLTNCPGCHQVIELPHPRPPKLTPVKKLGGTDWLNEFLIALCGVIALGLMGVSLIATPTNMIGAMAALWAITFSVFGVILKR